MATNFLPSHSGWRPPVERRGTCRLLLAVWVVLAGILGLCLPGPVQAATSLNDWRTQAGQTRVLAENDVPRAYTQAQRLQASLPADATPVDRARVLNLLSRIEVYLSLTEKAQKNAETALELAQQQGDRVGQAEAQLNVALNAVNQARIDASITATTRSVELLEDMNRPDLLGEALLRMSMMYRRVNDFDNSVTMAMQAMEIAKRTKDPLALTYAHQGLAISFDLSGRYAQAGEHYLQMRDYARIAHSKILEAHAVHGLGGVTASLGRVAEGERLTREAIAMFRSVGSPFSLSYGLFGFADLLRKQGRYGEAVRLLEEVVAIYEKYPNPIGLWFTLNARSTSLQALSRNAAARADAERAYGLAKEIALPVYLSGSARRMAEIGTVDGDHQRAYQLFVEAADLADKVAREKASARMVELAERYATENKQREINELTRRNEQQSAELRQRALQERWLWTVLGGSALVFAGSAYFLLRLRRSNRMLEALNTQVQRSQNQLQATFDAIPDPLFVLGLDGRYYDCRSSRADLLAAPAEDLIGKTVSDVLPPEAASICLSALREANEKGTSTGKQFELQLAHGRAWFELSVARKSVGQGQEPRFIVLSRDITERKQAEEALRIAATAFESQEGMTVTDAQGAVLRINRAFTEITGYSADEVVGHNPRLLQSGRHDKAFYAAMWESIRRTGSWQGEIWNRRKNGEAYPELLSITAVKENGGIVTHYVGTFMDITRRKAAEDEIRNLAFFDLQTGLPNRRLLLDRLQQALAAGARHRRQGALLLIDLDNFKTLNDTLGHDKGDLLLQQVAQRLASCVHEGGTVARLGGDEFVVMLENLSEHLEAAATQAETLAKRILASLKQTYSLDGYEYQSTASIGITLFSEQQETTEDLLKRADLAMYQAKAVGRNTLRFFDPEMQAVVTSRAALEAGLRRAVTSDEFLLYYQAQVDGQGHLTGCEALLRWQHPERGLVAPGEFIALAEDTGLILPLGRWVLDAACTQLAQWATRPEMAHLTVAVNVSVRQFHQADFVNQVLTVLDSTGTNPQRLKLELTESLLIGDVEDVIAKMSILKEKGVGFSLDDFGTGYSSLSYLKRLPLDQLKIDQGFVRNILIDPNDAAIARMVIALGDSLGLAVIAEGVEIEAQRDFLARLGCHACQGYLFCRPLPLDQFEAFVRRV
ncbi:EAL domain-containing protein [Rhodoferax ferrireducens]|uniref:EAL domain-containing protein n=1 Tax=Rhodoferax ferrireducens TaxID=192843 RepID=UPI00298DD56D|nr:EAL domain-containing protein [Rhodoferax ferrireducens]WPC66186.1 EAL domain-containing protein [Rhodoferax ferrireducens]